MLEWTIRQTDKEAVLKNEQTHKISAMALEDRMMRYQRDVDARMDTELDSRVLFISDEIAVKVQGARTGSIEG